jgi:hypothetical protein
MQAGAFGAGVTPWGAGVAAPGITPWGAGLAIPGIAPFGAGKAPGVAPFGAGKAPGVTPFGVGKAPGVTPFGAGKAAPVGVAPACATVLGPVANVCQQATAVTTVTPTTTVTPIPTAIAPQVYQGAPVVADVQTYPLPAAAAPLGKAVPTAVPGVGAFGQVITPWGAAVQATTGVVPGIYTTDVALPGIF